MVAVGPVGNSHKVGPGEGLVGVPGLVGADDAPLHQLGQIVVRPVGPRRAHEAGDARKQAQRQRRGQQEGHRPDPQGPACHMLCFLHRVLLSVRWGAIYQKSGRAAFLNKK